MVTHLVSFSQHTCSHIVTPSQTASSHTIRLVHTGCQHDMAMHAIHERQQTLRTWISEPMTMLGLSVGLPSFLRRICHLRFMASPPSRIASLQGTNRADRQGTAQALITRC